MEIPDNIPLFTISAAATILKISIPTLRLYEKEGLIIPYKSDSNQRMYSKIDLERVECIRRAIKKEKISINGIKTIYSLIPCWDLVKCSEKDREKCSAYNETHKPCWSYKNDETICESNNCRECTVYNDYSKCDDIKNLIKNISKGKEWEHFQEEDS